MANVISAANDTDTHYLHSGFSSTITSSYGSPSTTPFGISWDGNNVISADGGTDTHYLHVGFSSTITSSYTSPSNTPQGITWDGSNVISSGHNPTEHYLHSGFSSTVLDSYVSPSLVPTGITWDGSNVIAADSYSDLHYLHSGSALLSRVAIRHLPLALMASRGTAAMLSRRTSLPTFIFSTLVSHRPSRTVTPPLTPRASPGMDGMRQQHPTN